MIAPAILIGPSGRSPAPLPQPTVAPDQDAPSSTLFKRPPRRRYPSRYPATAFVRHLTVDGRSSIKPLTSISTSRSPETVTEPMETEAVIVAELSRSPKYRAANLTEPRVPPRDEEPLTLIVPLWLADCWRRRTRADEGAATVIGTIFCEAIRREVPLPPTMDPADAELPMESRAKPHAKFSHAAEMPPTIATDLNSWRESTRRTLRRADGLRR